MRSHGITTNARETGRTSTINLATHPRLVMLFCLGYSVSRRASGRHDMPHRSRAMRWCGASRSRDRPVQSYSWHGPTTNRHPHAHTTDPTGLHQAYCKSTTKWPYGRDCDPVRQSPHLCMPNEAAGRSGRRAASRPVTCADCITAASWATKVYACSAARWTRTTTKHQRRCRACQ